MNHLLCVYDIPESLKIPNPSPYFRRYGFRINLSCWVFPGHLVPTERIERLRQDGATVELVQFAEQSQEKILEMARNAVKEHCRKTIWYVEEKCERLRDDLNTIDFADKHESMYRRWRSVLSRARRELVAAEQCVIGFGILRDTEAGLDSLKHLLTAQLGAALAWREANPAGQRAAAGMAVPA